MKYVDLSGEWQCEIPGQCVLIHMPGTLEENGIGFPDSVQNQWHLENASAIGLWREDDPIMTRLTRKYTFEGEAQFFRTLAWEVPRGKRVFLESERARRLSLWVNGQSVLPCDEGNLISPWVFEITDQVTGQDTIRIISDNSYSGWPREALMKSSACADETQTNWNGLLGYLRLRLEDQVFISDVHVYPKEASIDIRVVLDAGCSWEGALQVACKALARPAAQSVAVQAGRTEIWFRNLPVHQEIRHWDIEEGNLYTLSVYARDLKEKTVSFGMRNYQARNGCFWLNNRRIFLRSEANCAVFPETGYAPMDVEAWKGILSRYRAYGVNCIRFHSHCPPEAAFVAADELGLLMQPELSNWDPKNTFADEEAVRYYRNEMVGALRMLANHPSFIMMTLGNELRADAAGHEQMHRLIGIARAYDATRLFADGSNTHFGFRGHDEESDFYTAMTYIDQDLRGTSGDMLGWLNRAYPNGCVNYDAPINALRAKTDQPVYSFEVGQYETLPDFDEISDYQGVTKPDNLMALCERAKEKGFQSEWKQRVSASGELALLCYRAEVEAALRTADFSGISLLGLQDFPGQGTALVGMMNAHLRPKPHDFAKPERFRAFFRDALPLALFPKYTYTNQETMSVNVRIANYGKKDLMGETEWQIDGGDWRWEGKSSEVVAKQGQLTDGGCIKVLLTPVKVATKFTLTVRFAGLQNSYAFWVYPERIIRKPESVYECVSLDETACSILEEGGRVYLSPDSSPEALPASIACHFSTDFWNVCSFVHQSGSMGQFIDVSHPLFRTFPTDAHTDWQWWPMATQRAIILPEKIDTVIAEMDSYATMRPMAMMFECRCGNGKLLVSSMGLQHLQQYPEARALQRSIYEYMASCEFEPKQTLPIEFIRSIVSEV
ncbi:MAG: hypothetical protein IJ153_02250 [Clostridia bacterium]|nr:hypothetical protein [Clostridia bacterium]